MNHEQAEKVLDAVIEQGDGRPCDIAQAVLLAKALRDIETLQKRLAQLESQLRYLGVVCR